jgi:hypothetical protein
MFVAGKRFDKLESSRCVIHNTCRLLVVLPVRMHDASRLKQTFRFHISIGGFAVFKLTSILKRL